MASRHAADVEPRCVAFSITSIRTICQSDTSSVGRDSIMTRARKSPRPTGRRLRAAFLPSIEFLWHFFEELTTSKRIKPYHVFVNFGFVCDKGNPLTQTEARGFPRIPNCASQTGYGLEAAEMAI